MTLQHVLKEVTHLASVTGLLIASTVATAAVTLTYRLRSQTLAMLKPTLEALKTVSSQIDDLLTPRLYIRDSQRQLVVGEARRALAPTQSIGWLLFSKSNEKALAGKVSSFVANSESLVAKANRAFVESELVAFKEFFDTVESRPLTQAQRRSCVIDEDNTLVLAGAGTGKTSTMIGRAGYLLASKRARPDELLMLAFAKKASEETQERQDSRLKRWLHGSSPAVKTFHALGLQILSTAEGRKPALSPLAEDDYRLEQFVNDQIAEGCKDPEYRAMLVRYYASERFPYHNPFDFASMQEYYEYVRTYEVRTLTGDPVKSFEECVIANFLSANSVNFMYERPYEVDTSGPDFRRYQPDFYLPDYGVYIEHFALDRNGQPPAHFNQKKYLDGVEWKRALHLKHGTTLIETYSYLKREGRLESHLTQALRNAGVKLRPKSSEELLEELRSSSKITDMATLMSGFLTLFKQSDFDLEGLRTSAARHKNSTRMLVLLDLFAPILKAYEIELSECRQIDFADMIRKATRYVEAGTYQSPFTYILVDEFQDISGVRARLITALVRQRPATALFVVGDDWQAIYRFTGSDIAYTRDFPRHFGATEITALDKTFRFNDKIGDVASKFVLKNPAQIVKSIQSVTTTPAPAISLVRVVHDADGLGLALGAISTRSKSKATVLVLGRYNFTLDEYRASASRLRIKNLYPSLDVDYMTVHAAKGKEADFVVVLGLGRGKNGFPSEKPTDPFLELLLPDPEPYPLAEERRLFYVALTRARHRAYLVYNPLEASSFVTELLARENGYPICTDEFDSDDICADIPHVSCPQCGTGILVPRTGPHGPFFGCNNYPYCKYTEDPCPKCGGLVRRNGNVCTCTNPECSAVMPICPKCGGVMVERQGRYGKFWGCTNYRSNAEFVCTYTINIRPSGQSSTSRKSSSSSTRRRS